MNAGRTNFLNPQFVEFIPSTLQGGILYISKKYGVVTHLCCCGCKNKVVTPIVGGQWQLIEEGEYVSLDPSIGNTNFPCRSHYFITRNKVEWCYDMTDKGAQRSRRLAAIRQQRYFEAKNAGESKQAQAQRPPEKSTPPEKWSLWDLIKRIFSD